METSYETEGFNKLMEKYNFDSPIEVTLVIEEEDLTEPVLSKGLLVSDSTNVPNTNVSPNSFEVYKRIVSNTDKAKNKMPNAKRKCNSRSAVGENNLLISVNETTPKGGQEKSQDLQWQLLDAVADNLIHITKYHYYNFVNMNVQMEDYEKLKYEYVTIKHYFFYLSYNTTVAILLPREHDILFFNDFIHRVITIANRSLWFQISYEMLGILIRDMLIWTKQKRKKLDVKLSSHNHDRSSMAWTSSAATISNSINHPRQVLNRPFETGTTTNYLAQRTNRHPDTVLETLLPHSEQVMNISPHIRQISNYSAQELARFNISHQKKYLMQDIDNPTSIGHIKSNATYKRTEKCHNYCSEKVQSEPEINISSNFVQRTNHSNHEPSIPLNIYSKINNTTQGISRLPYNGSRINHSTETITSIYNNESKTNKISTCKAINTNTNKILLSTGPPNQEITISVDTEILANINQKNTNKLNNNAIECQVNDAHGTKSVKRRKTNDSSYYPYNNLNIVPHHNDNNIHFKKNNCSATAFKSLVDGLCHDDSRKIEYELLNTDTLRSSISRDSGFGSPIYGSFRNEQTIETPTNEEQETPIISHVTSMNPNAIHLYFGSCKICGATTNNMCFGCYKEYYCSFLCQTKDWEKHKYACSG